MFSLVITVVQIISIVSCQVVEDFTLTTALGKLKGTYLTSVSGQQFYAFRGIPYAQPPIGEKRFKAPEPIDQWTGVFDATSDGPMCPQPYSDESEISEDCLRLNVYTRELPSERHPNIKRPVIVYIHPGGLYSLSGQSKNFAGPQYLMDRQIVLVTFNYRLGALGFLSANTKEAPGNAGFKDQVLVLKWIKLHINKFGGDPNLITLLGYGAGAISASLHLVSPMSKNLFQRAIIMSGSTTAQWRISSAQINLTKRQARLVNCTDPSIHNMVSCLKSTSYLQFANSLRFLFDFGEGIPFLLWKPVIESDFGQERFLIEDPVDTFKNGNFMKVPLISGITRDEFVGPAIRILENNLLRNELDQNFAKYAPICFMYESQLPRSQNISTELRATYLGSGSLHPQRSLKGLSELFADALIGFGVHRLVHLAARYTKVYYYRFSYEGRNSHIYYPNVTPYGVVHHDDLLYLFVEPSVSRMYNSNDEEYQTIEILTRMWAAFAYKGDPNKAADPFLKTIKWRPFSFRRELFLEFGQDNVTMKEQLYTDRFGIWKQLFPLHWIRSNGKADTNMDYPA